MANTDYVNSGLGSFAAAITLDTAVDEDAAIFSYTDFNFPRQNAVVIGSSAMIDEEVVQVVDIGIRTYTMRRGCADTIPAPHAVDAVCWFLDGTVGSDRREHGATQTIGVKVTPFTTGGGAVPLSEVPPQAVTFNWRFFRPYPPAQMKINGARWHVPTAVSEAQPNLSMHWVDRDRILQANQLLGQDDAGIGPEPGTTYTLRVYDSAATLLRTEVGIRGNTFNYQWPQVVHDFGARTDGYLAFTATRQQFDSLQHYEMHFTVNSAGTIPSNFLPFDQGAVESPYMINLISGAIAVDNYAMGFAARPADRMADDYALLGAPSAPPQNHFTPWVTTDFRLPELETILNVRSSSLYDGVPLSPALNGKLALIDDEVVQLVNISDSQIVIARGVADTVPKVHLPGARLWLVDAARSFDTISHGDGTTNEYKFVPGVYGPPIDPATLPANLVAFNGRSRKPYAPGQVVVSGRPWFEEISATSGGSTLFSWARRNRLTQGAVAYDHAQDDVEPEAGQVTTLTFYFETPPATPGASPVQHVLRTASIAGKSYSYPYSLALDDGNVAGLATGVCGTVVIFVRIEAVRGIETSWQNYVVSLRLPSFPCTP